MDCGFRNGPLRRIDVSARTIPQPPPGLPLPSKGFRNRSAWTPILNNLLFPRNGCLYLTLPTFACLSRGCRQWPVFIPRGGTSVFAGQVGAASDEKDSQPPFKKGFLNLGFRSLRDAKGSRSGIVSKNRNMPPLTGLVISSGNESTTMSLLWSSRNVMSKSGFAVAKDEFKFYR